MGLPTAPGCVTPGTEGRVSCALSRVQGGVCHVRVTSTVVANCRAGEGRPTDYEDFPRAPARASLNTTLADQLDHAILRLDPTHAEALARQTQKAANAPGVKAARAADLYATGLAAAPDSAEMQRGLDQATYGMLRGVRWLALLCVAFAGSGMDLFAVAGKVQRDLPLPLGQRLWYLVVATAIWIVGALLRYRRRRAGVQLNVRSLIRRRRWPRKCWPRRPGPCCAHC